MKKQSWCMRHYLGRPVDWGDIMAYVFRKSKTLGLENPLFSLQSLVPKQPILARDNQDVDEELSLPHIAEMVLAQNNPGDLLRSFHGPGSSFPILLAHKRRILLHGRGDKAPQRSPAIRRRRRSHRRRLTAALRALLSIHMPIRLPIDIHSLLLDTAQPRQANPKPPDLALNDPLLPPQSAPPALQTAMPDPSLPHLPEPLLGLAFLQQVRQGVGEGVEVRDELVAGASALRRLLPGARLLDARDEGGVLDEPLVPLAVDERVAGRRGVRARRLARRVRRGPGFGGEFGAQRAPLRGDYWGLGLRPALACEGF
ncbi:hypothetical protein F4781DRAFT_251521 [Annulohypoxylon bovei var. microspora]|nr:hypothetical protein F4781DRAFT_251521 [Annulohypoxylon bovei var. microspora]